MLFKDNILLEIKVKEIVIWEEDLVIKHFLLFMIELIVVSIVRKEI